MKEEFVFYEYQRFYKSWNILIILISAVVNILLIFGCIVQLGMGKSFGNPPMNNTMLIIITALITLLTVSFFFARLATVINNEGVYIKVFPFFLKYKCFPWDNIAKAYLIKYNPLTVSGIRHSAVIYSVSGNTALQLELIKGKQVLIGTRKPVELEEVLQKLNKQKQVAYT